MKYPTLAIMRQAEKMYGCNCDACCSMTPLAKQRRQRLERKYAKRKNILAVVVLLSLACTVLTTPIPSRVTAPFVPPTSAPLALVVETETPTPRNAEVENIKERKWITP
jgi:hypothetical protein